MGRMTLGEDEGLRLHGWREFRSQSRDHVIPMSGPGGKLQRIKIGEALPASSVFSGVAATAEERALSASARAQALAEARGMGEAKPLGITQYLTADLASVSGNPSAVDFITETLVIGRAPFDGYVSEFEAVSPALSVALAIAIRTSGGATLFQTRTTQAAFPVGVDSEPDFLSQFQFSAANDRVSLRNLKMPVFSGEDILAVVQLNALTAVGQRLFHLILGFEGYILARPGSQAAVSQFGALIDDSRVASREVIAQSSRLELQRQKDSAALQRAQIDLEIAKLRSPGSPGPSGFLSNPFQGALLSESALQQLQSRAAPRPLAPKVVAAPPAVVSGTGQTFVSAWNPSFGNIGYLIPDPPRGGRVNVFDNTYTVWDITGRNVGSGQIVPVRSDVDIPPGARISPVTGGRGPTGLIPASGPGSGQF